MESQKKKKQWTNADWFSAVGFLFFLILAFLGYALEFSWTISFLYAFLSVVAGWGALILLKRIRKVEDNLKAWRIAEWIAFAVFFCVFVFWLDRPVIRIFSIAVVNKSEIQADARRDVSRLRELYSEYERQEEEAIKITRDILMLSYKYPSLNPYTQSLFDGKAYNALQKDAVDKYIESRYEDFLSKSGPGSSATATGIEGDYATFKERHNLSEIAGMVESFNFWDIPMLGMLEGKCSIAAEGERITAFLENKRTKTNVDGCSYLFSLDANDRPVVCPDRPYTFDSSFKKSLDGMMNLGIGDIGRIWLPALLSLLVNVLMFFSYFVAYRSTKVEIKKRKNKNSSPLGGTYLD
ncbi:MAG: hypothetical protein ACI395_09450 [Candidatus Cryptobacteroides sp.]